MIPIDLPEDGPEIGVDTDVTPRTGSGDSSSVSSYLLRFTADVTPSEAEAVLNRLEPPEEGIVLASSGAVIVRAGDAFAAFAEERSCVELVHGVRLKTWEPSRHQRPG